jgi:hypothetical protein
MAHRASGLDCVCIATPFSLTVYVALLNEFADNSLGSPFRNSDSLSYLAHSDTRVAGDADENVSVISKERPAGHSGKGSRCYQGWPSPQRGQVVPASAEAVKLLPQQQL